MPNVKSVLPLALFLPLIFSACNTIENRRTEYRSTKVNGPYTRALHDGTWANDKTVDEEYAKAREQRRMNPTSSAPATTAPAKANPPVEAN